MPMSSSSDVRNRALRLRSLAKTYVADAQDTGAAFQSLFRVRHALVFLVDV